MKDENSSESLASPGESWRVLSESLATLDDDSITPEPVTFTEAIDPIDILVRFIQRITQLPSSTRFPVTKDRDRLIVTLLLAILSDPNHHINKFITKPLLKVYLERGGRIPQQGILSRSMRDRDQFDHTVQYLYDYGLSIPDIARTLGTHPNTIHKHLKYIREEDQKISTEC